MVSANRVAKGSILTKQPNRSVCSALQGSIVPKSDVQHVLSARLDRLHNQERICAQPAIRHAENATEKLVHAHHVLEEMDLTMESVPSVHKGHTPPISSLVQTVQTDIITTRKDRHHARSVETIVLNATT